MQVQTEQENTRLATERSAVCCTLRVFDEDAVSQLASGYMDFLLRHSLNDDQLPELHCTSC